MVKSVINGDLAVASHWFDDNKLVLNPEKCNCIVLPKNYPFSICDVQVGMVDHLELLGVSIDNSLNFSKDIGKMTEKVENRLDVRERRRREPLWWCWGLLPQKILKSKGLEMQFPAFSKSYL